LQAVSEFYWVVTRKRMMPRDEAASLARTMIDLFPTAGTSPAPARAALALSVAGHASYWDALLLATAAQAGCTAILTEDLADGASLAGVRVINPFAATGLSPAAEILLATDEPSPS